ncbi:hypothetical protein OKW96_04860 [Sphingobacterium sp. KU25419]|nr:hypothetical protein OKW96_04860 [Sphingobacterium sp. KU25419]
MLIIERDQNEVTVYDEAVVDVLYIDWYEVNKTLLTRQTEGGRLVRLYRADAPPLESGEIIYSTSQFTIQIHIKPCTCIVLQTDDLTTIGHFVAMWAIGICRCFGLKIAWHLLMMDSCTLL